MSALFTAAWWWWRGQARQVQTVEVRQGSWLSLAGVRIALSLYDRIPTDAVLQKKQRNKTWFVTGQSTIRLGSVHGTAELWTMHEHAQLSVLVFFLSGHWFRTATTDGFTTPCQVATLSRVYEVVDAPCLLWLADDALPNLFAPIRASGSAFHNWTVYWRVASLPGTRFPMGHRLPARIYLGKLLCSSKHVLYTQTFCRTAPV